MLSPKEKILIFFEFAVSFGSATIELAGIASILPFMAVVAKPDIVQTNRWLKKCYDFFHFTNLHSFLYFLGVVVLGLLIFTNVYKAASTWLKLKIDNQLHYNMTRRLLASYLSHPYEFFLNRNTSELGKNILCEVDTVISGILSSSMNILSSAMLSFFILVLLTIVNPAIAVAIAAILGGTYTTIFMLVRNRLDTIGLDQVYRGTMKFRAASDALAGIKDLKILGRESAFLEKYAENALAHARHNAAAGILIQIPRYAMETIAFGGILLIILYSLKSEQDVARIVPILSIYAFSGYRMMPALQQIFAGISTVRMSLPNLEVVHRDLIKGMGAADPELVWKNNKSMQPISFNRDLVLHNISFNYQDVTQPAVQDINITIKHNTYIGFVGATGSGKTTAVDIILGLLAPTSGRLIVDGIDIQGENLARWQLNFGYVPQHIYLCDDTITRNIAFGVLENEIDMAAVVRSARIANLHDFVEKEMPRGYDTFIGERGLRLSGGQRQRIGIARALYRDPSVLIMDEATSALDGITEEAVMEAIRALSQKKTIITIAHRLTTVKDCDVIYLWDHGRIVSVGSYDDLMADSRWFKAASRIGIQA